MRQNRKNKQNTNRWLVSYADLITLLFATFVILYALAQSDGDSFSNLQASLRQAFSTSLSGKLFEGSEGIFQSTNSKKPIDPMILENISSAYEEENFVAIRNELENLKRRQNFEGLSSRLDERGLSIVIDDNSSLFFPSSARLNAKSTDILDEVGKIVNDKFKNHYIRIEGHTDSSPVRSQTYPSNWELSSARACAVAKYLIQNQGFAPNIISVSGYAHTRPLNDNSSPSLRVLNNRIEILIVKNKYKEIEKPVRVIYQNSNEDKINDVQIEKTYFEEQHKKDEIKKPKFMLN